MLEHPGLLLCPWRWEASPPGMPSLRTRRILDLQSRAFLGLVRPLPSQAWPPFRWLSRRAWQVLETEDESLLLTLYAPWGLIRPWEVHDAEERRVCSIHAGDIYDAGGCLRARSAVQPHCVALLGKDRVELATVTLAADGQELRFAPCLETDPYAKMAMLGRALSLHDSRSV